jgi:hypothetical protein
MEEGRLTSFLMAVSMFPFRRLSSVLSEVAGTSRRSPMSLLSLLNPTFIVPNLVLAGGNMLLELTCTIVRAVKAKPADEDAKAPKCESEIDNDQLYPFSLSTLVSGDELRDPLIRKLILRQEEFRRAVRRGDIKACHGCGGLAKEVG